jgi:hypothetical protein
LLAGSNAKSADRAQKEFINFRLKAAGVLIFAEAGKMFPSLRKP